MNICSIISNICSIVSSPVGTSLIGVVVGWLLGYCGTLRVEQRKREQLRKDFKEGLSTELREAQKWLSEDYGLLTEELETKNPETTTLGLKKYNLSFLQESISSFSLLESCFRVSVLSIRTKIDYLNSEIDRYNFFFEKTFDATLTSNDRLSIIANIKISYKGIAKLSFDIAEEIKKLKPQEETGD
ncbi:MAG: hypothetical protein PHX21_09840 [bacterium]|nr:hypothetical protein [bacterium]